MQKIKTVIVGAGNIAGMKSKAIGLKPAITHIQALINLKEKFELVAIIDKNINNAIALKNKWSVPATASDVIPSGADMYVVSTDQKSHRKVVEEIIQHKPKIILLEKPGGNDIQDALDIDAMCKEAGCKLYINFQRNYIFCREDVKVIGKVKCAEIHYVRGVMNDASHAIALMLHLFGTISEYSNAPKTIVSRSCINDKPGDPTLTAFIRVSGICGDVVMIGHDGRDYDVFEIRLWGERGTLTFSNHGMKISLNSVKREEVYGDYNTLSSESVVVKETVTNSLLSVYENIFVDEYLETYDPCVDYVAVWHYLNSIFFNRGKAVY